jgi:putative ABC transport system ATP-binding protein
VTASELRAEGLVLDLGGRTVLQGIGLTARAGEPLAVSGPSGSGKTVLLLVLAGLISPTRGTVLVDGAPMRSGHDRSDVGVGIVLQTQGLVPELTADENVALPLQGRGLAAGDVTDRAKSALTAVGLGAVGNRLAGELSGGQRQRVGVARALAGAPAIVIADEPTAELDPDNRALVLSLLLGSTPLLDSAPPRIVVVASNDPEVSSACHHVLHLRDGRMDVAD